MFVRIVLAILSILGAVWHYHDLPEYRTAITIFVGIPLATLALIVRRKHVFPIVCCTLFSLLGALFNTAVYCTGDGTRIDAESMISGVVIGWLIGVALNYAHQRALADRHDSLVENDILTTHVGGEP